LTPSRSRILTIVGAFVLLAGIGGIASILLRSKTHEGGGGGSLERNAGFHRVSDPSLVADPGTHARAAENVRAALKDGPNLLSTTAAVPPFDRAAFERDPSSYLAKVVPARCFQTAEPGPETAPLETKSPARTVVPAGGVAPLWVRSAPDAPVTFTAFDGGEFKENGLASITVRADGRGLASAHFVATPGIEGDLTIVAGSPLNSGVQRFVFRVVK
jgi:hypothetical protein